MEGEDIELYDDNDEVLPDNRGHKTGKNDMKQRQFQKQYNIADGRHVDNPYIVKTQKYEPPIKIVSSQGH